MAFMKGIGAKEAAQWLMSFVDNEDVRESVQ
jgi:hypothetical protein